LSTCTGSVKSGVWPTAARVCQQSGVGAQGDLFKVRFEVHDAPDRTRIHRVVVREGSHVVVPAEAVRCCGSQTRVPPASTDASIPCPEQRARLDGRAGSGNGGRSPAATSPRAGRRSPAGTRRSGRHEASVEVTVHPLAFKTRGGRCHRWLGQPALSDPRSVVLDRLLGRCPGLLQQTQQFVRQSRLVSGCSARSTRTCSRSFAAAEVAREPMMVSRAASLSLTSQAACNLPVASSVVNAVLTCPVPGPRACLRRAGAVRLAQTGSMERPRWPWTYWLRRCRTSVSMSLPSLSR
jgi:hypothetical protein